MRKKLFYFFILFVALNLLLVGIFFIPNVRITDYIYKEEMIINKLTNKYNFTNIDLRVIEKENVDTNDIRTLDVSEDEGFYPIEGIDIKTYYFESAKCAMIKCIIPSVKYHNFRYHLALNDDTMLLNDYVTIYSSIRYGNEEFYFGRVQGNEESNFSNVKLKLLNQNIEYRMSPYDININVTIYIDLECLNYDKHPVLNFSLYEERGKLNKGIYLGHLYISPKNNYQITKTSKMNTCIELGGK